MNFVDASGILSANNGMNLYRGCTHGCIYCDSRSRCYQFTHEFEDIEVKQNAPQLLEAALRSKRKKCMIVTGSMCDPYMHCEEKLQLTRRCLEVINRYEFGVTLQTKSNRILRDLDLLKEINQHSKSIVQMTLTTFDEDLCKIVEPNVCTTKERFETLKIMADNHISTVVWISPLLPFINDTKENLEGILNYCVEARVHAILFLGAGMTLRDGDREYYYQALERHFPGLKQKYQKKYGNAYEILSDNHRELTALLERTCQENNILYKSDEVFAYQHEFPERYQQMSISELFC